MDGQILITANNEGYAIVIKIDIEKGIDQAKVVHRIKIESKFLFYADHPNSRSVILDNMLYFIHDRFSLIKIDAKTLQIIKEEKIHLPDSVVEKTEDSEFVKAEHFGIVKDDSTHSMAVVYNDKQ